MQKTYSMIESGIIYLITNVQTKKCYVGSTTVGIEKRWRMHKAAYKWSKLKLYQDMRQHGFSCYSISEIDTFLTRSERRFKETDWMYKLGTYFPFGLNKASNFPMKFKSSLQLAKDIRSIIHPKQATWLAKKARIKYWYLSNKMNGTYPFTPEDLDKINKAIGTDFVAPTINL